MSRDEVPLVIVVPIYEDIDAASLLFKEIARTVQPAPFVVAVDDGSIAQPVSPSLLATSGLRGVVLKLKRNVGHQKAIATGLSFASDRFGDDVIVVAMDSDGEDVPATISEIVKPLVESRYDVIVASRRSRVETVRFRAFYVVYKALFKLLTGRKISFGNFMALRNSGVKRLAVMPELWTHVAASVLSSKLRVATVPVDRGPRYAGKSKMNFVGLALHGFRALMVFAEDVLVRVGIACTIVAILAVSGGFAAMVLKAFGFATPGWFSLASGILLLVFLQTGALTLITLMLSGMIRTGGIISAEEYRAYVDQELYVESVDQI